ncbi:PREDICTED: zinc finger protein 883-like [Miniopterus natalensis]|uniref:zinc finger protein 883-like n=1 Tax=Miniopterus natalensis TaxID=291302 RepID=UPI0007A6EC61|nr:PREDICTED: zinc finger protein 883-like [Miniopterus natalensis]
MENFLMAASVGLAICRHPVIVRPMLVRQLNVPDKTGKASATTMIQGSSGPGCGNQLGDKNGSSLRGVSIKVSQVRTLTVHPFIPKSHQCAMGDPVLKDMLHLAGQQGTSPGQQSYKSCGRAFSVNHGQMPRQQSGETSGTMKKGQDQFVKSGRCHVSENAFTCKKGGKDFSASSGLVQHQATNNGEKSYLSTEYKGAYRTEQRSYRCSECGQIFGHKDTCGQNQNSQMRKESYECNQCGKFFNNDSDFMLHKKSHNKAICYQCVDCGEYFKYSTSLEVHLKMHKEMLNSYQCAECGEIFQENSYLIQHQKTHTDPKPYECSECQKTFARKNGLTMHQKSHTAGAKLFECSECQKTFSRKSSLTQHQKIHSPVRPHSCDICGKGFHRKGRLLDHQMMHTGEKIYQCDECGKLFRYKSSLAAHKKIHNASGLYMCSECGKAYGTSTHLNQHKKVHNKASPSGEENVGNSLVAASASSPRDKTLEQGLMYSANVGESTEDSPTSPP